MTNKEIQVAANEAAAKPTPSKSDVAKRLLSRKAGATAAEVGEATGWQPHSVRAFLSGLRKKGAALAGEERRDGTKAYRLSKAAKGAAN